MKTAVLVSGRGTNLRAICSAIDRGTCSAQVVGVISDRQSAAALDYAKERGIDTRVVPLKKGDDRDLWNLKLAEVVASFEPGLVVLAGFMRVLGSPLLERFPGRIINVHPALLPSFPGHTGAQDAIAGGVRITGCTVHIVDAGVDTGPIIAQAAVPVLSTDTPQSLHQRIQAQEHQLLPAVIDGIARGDIQLDPLSITTPDADSHLALISPSF